MNTEMPIERVAFSVREVANMFGVSEWLVREDIRAHRLPSVRMGGRILIPRWAVQRALGAVADTAPLDPADPAERDNSNRSVTMMFTHENKVTSSKNL